MSTGEAAVGARLALPGAGAPPGLSDAILDAARAANIGLTLSHAEGDRTRLVYVSDTAVEILGYPADELLVRDAILNIAEEQRTELRALALRRSLEAVPAKAFETVVVQKSGKRVPISVSVSQVEVGGRLATVSFFQDITARKEAEAALIASEARFRSVIESAPDGIAITRQGIIHYLNPSAVKLLGYDHHDELVGKPLGALLDAEGRDAMRRRIAAMLETGQRFPPREYAATRRDGSVVIAEITSIPLEFEGAPAIIAFARDVTERRRLQSQLARANRLAALGTLAAGVAHEVNNPLAFLAIGIEAMERYLSSAVPDEARMREGMSLLGELRHGTDRVAAIVRDLRAFSRAEDDRPGPVDLVAVLDSAERMASHEIRHRAVLSRSYAGLPLVEGSAGRLEQVFVNLLLNAAQSLTEGKAGNAIALMGRVEGERVVVEVIDNGAGIPDDLLPRVFDPFFTTKPTGVGTGLGLSICHGIVSQLGGDIVVESIMGKGTTVRVTLPKSVSRGPGLAPPIESVAPAAGARSRVLIVDDEAALGVTLKCLLEDEHDVTAVTSGQEALTMLMDGVHFDLILCDLMMPGITGVDIFERLKAARPGTEERIVFMTGGAFTPRTVSFLAQVPNARLEKPFPVKDLEDLLRRRPS